MKSSRLFLAIVAFAWCITQAVPSNQQLTLRHLEEEEEGKENSHEGVCREDYNYKHPHPCKPEVKDSCTFIVKWRRSKMEKTEGDGHGGEVQEDDLSEGWAEFDVMATLPADMDHHSSVWIALGFSPTSKMGDTDVISCWRTNNGTSYIHDGYTKTDGHVFVMDTDDEEEGENQVRLKEIHVEDRSFHCKFQRKMNTGDYLQDKDLDDGHFVLLASGFLEENEGSLSMLKHFSHVATTCACNVTACSKRCSCPGGIFYQFLKLHGIVMNICFMFLIPFGSILSRYYKVVFVRSWFKAHVTTMMIALLWSLVAFGLVLAHTRGKFSIGYHQILGMQCLAMLTIQPIIGFIRPEKKDTITWKRVVFNIFHQSMAGSIFIVSIMVLFLGAFLFHNSVVNFMYGVLTLYIILNISFFVLLEFLKRSQNFYTIPPVGYHKVTHLDELTCSESEEEVYVKNESTKPRTPIYMLFCTKCLEYRQFIHEFIHYLRGRTGPGPRLEKGLLALFLTQNLILALTLSALIFYFDAAD